MGNLSIQAESFKVAIIIASVWLRDVNLSKKNVFI